LPTMVTETACITMLKPAVTSVSASSVNAHVGEASEHGPIQPSKLVPAAGLADNMTGVPRGSCMVQAAPQSMPAGDDVTLPEPDPVFLTLSVHHIGGVDRRVERRTAVRAIGLDIPTPKGQPEAEGRQRDRGTRRAA